MQSQFTEKNSRTIIAHTLSKKNLNDFLGFIQPIAEITNGKMMPLTKENFCPTEKAFITSNYELLEKTYPDRKVFQINVSVSEKISEHPNECHYVASASDASIIRSKDFFEIVSSKLPLANHRIIVPDEIPGTTYIFIRDGDATYGPFSWSKISKEPGNIAIKIDFLDTPLPGVSLTQFQCYKIASSKVDTEGVKAMGSSRVFVQGLSILSGADYFDYASDDEIVRYAMKIAGDQGMRIVERSKAESMVTFIRRNPKFQNEEFTKKRLQRLLEIVDITEKTRSEIAKSVSAFFNTDAGRPIIQSFIAQNESVFLERLRKDSEATLAAELADIRADIAKSEKRVAELNETKTRLHNEVQNLQNEAKRDADMTKIYAANDEIIAQRRNAIAELDEQIASLRNQYKMGQTIEALKKDIEYNERRKDEAIDDRKRAEQARKEIQEQLKDNTSQLQSRLLELKPFVEAITGSFSTQEQIIENITVATKPMPGDNDGEKQGKLVQTIQNALHKKGRSIHPNEVANLLITCQQSFLTIFAGPPGTGKTSLARLIASTQNLSPRLREVAVSRGWTSQKDLLGYYNPLTTRFQAASTGMDSFLRALSAEKAKDPGMAYVLLDEANLSPIEHYWSAFMGLADHEEDRKLILGNETLTIPDTLRFIATINYDGTTEPLSPRLINRAPIIVLENNDHKEVAKVAQEYADVLPVSASQMNALFGISPDIPEMEDSEGSIYELIRKALQEDNANLGLPVAISARKENAIRQYLGKARSLMNVDSDIVALDFAVQQHVLPLIQGHGPKFGKRLENLRSILEDNYLSRSQKTLERIISYGESDLHTYDFFCW